MHNSNPSNSHAHESASSLDSKESSGEQVLSTYGHNMDEALSFIKKYDRFLVVAHVNPDGDAISSTLAVGWQLQQWNKHFVMVNDNRVPSRLSFLANSEAIYISERHPDAKPPAFDAVICVDCADYERIGTIADWIQADVPILNIDHHPTNNRYGEVALIREDAAATAEILFDLYEHGGIVLDVQAATALYTGLLTDTGGFRYSNTTPHVMEMASKLLQTGVQGNEIADRLLERMSYAQMLLIKRSLARLDFTQDRKIAWLHVTPEDMLETGALNEDLEGLVNYPRNVEGVEVGFLLKMNESGRIKVSLRSAGLVNVAKVAQHFGGGGHVRAAGCTLTVPLEQAIEAIIEQVTEQL